MGGILSCLVSQSLCCIGSNALSCCCKFINSSSISTRIGYALMFLLTASLSFVSTLPQVSLQINRILQINCLECVGILSVYRICAANCILHLFLSLLMIGVESSKDSRSKLQNGFWSLKLLIWMALIGLSIYIPNQVFIGIGKYLDIPGAFIFILVQVMSLSYHRLYC